MSLTFAVVIFFLIVVGLAVAPLIPAVIEVRRKSDAKPLRVVHESHVDIRHFAFRFRKFIETRLSSAMDSCRASGTVQDGQLKDGTLFVILPEDADSVPTVMPSSEGKARLIVALGGVELSANEIYPLEIYAGASVATGERTACRAVLAEGDVEFGKECVVQRWVYAGGTARAHEGCVLHGRLSAERAIRLDDGCGFERMHAGRIEFGESPAPVVSVPPDAARGKPLEARDLPRVLDTAAGRWLVKGNAEIPADSVVENDLVVTGELRIGARTKIRGSIKSHKNIVLKEDVTVEGSAVAGKNLYADPGGRIEGPVLAEENVYLAHGVEIGTENRPTTLSARQLHIRTGVVAHGTVWAYDDGRVRDWRQEP
jgi:predicted acyltransferase (DUF342 family)